MAAVSPVKVYKGTVHDFSGISYDRRTPEDFMRSPPERCTGQGLLTNLQYNTNDHTGASKRERSFTEENKILFPCESVQILYDQANENHGLFDLLEKNNQPLKAR